MPLKRIKRRNQRFGGTNLPQGSAACCQSLRIPDANCERGGSAAPIPHFSAPCSSHNSQSKLRISLILSPFSRCQFRGLDRPNDRPRISISAGKSLENCDFKLNTIGQNPVRAHGFQQFKLVATKDRPNDRPKSSDSQSICFIMNRIENRNFGHFVAN